jgi:hypothetical protein
MNTMQKLEKLQSKVSGMVGLLTFPTGKFKDSVSGETVDFSDMAKGVGQAISNHQLALSPHPGLSAAVGPDGKIDIDKLEKAFKNKYVDLEFLNAGTQGPDIQACLSLLDHYEALMFAGWLISPRTGLEGSHGTKAEADTHTESANEGSESLQNDIVANLNKNFVDPLLRLNFGDKAVGSFKIKAAPLTFTKAARNIGFIQTLCSQNQEFGYSIAKYIEAGGEIKGLENPILELDKFKVLTPPKPLQNSGMPQ